MFIACKFHELYPPVISDFIQVTKNSFTKEQLLAMEVSVMRTLQFDINYPSPATLLESYSLAVNTSADTGVLVHASLLVDLTLLSADFLGFRPSLVVICALATALACK